MANGDYDSIDVTYFRSRVSFLGLDVVSAEPMESRAVPQIFEFVRFVVFLSRELQVITQSIRLPSTWIAVINIILGLRHAQSRANAPAGSAKKLKTAALARVSSAGAKVTSNVTARVEEAEAGAEATVMAHAGDVVEAAERDAVVPAVAITAAPTAAAKVTTVVQGHQTAATTNAVETIGIANANEVVALAQGDLPAVAQLVISIQTSREAPAHQDTVKSRGRPRLPSTPTGGPRAKIRTTHARVLKSSETVTTSTGKTPEMCLTLKRDYSTRTPSDEANKKS